jgi:CubicO group peptidase (beta-lactamase class C family)
MSSARILLFLAFVVLALPVDGRGAADSLDNALHPYLDAYGLPALAAAVAVKGEIAAAGAVGVRRVGTSIPVTLNDRFHIGSDTKAMTALLAGMLVEEGKLRWDITPAEVFPDWAPGMDAGFKSATLAQLLSHSAGVPTDNEGMGELIDQALSQSGNLDALRGRLVRELSKKPLASPPGARFEYSNMGYVTAGAMLERVTGKTWEELIVERVFTPLGLVTAGLGPQSSLGRVDAPLGHALRDGRVKAFLAGPNGDNPSLIAPAGIAHMSILDFCRWAAWNAGEGKRGPALVRPETLRTLHAKHIALTPPEDAKPGTPNIKGGYALGWGVVEVDFAPHPVLEHGGSNNMNLAQIWVDVEKDLAMVLATNIGGKNAEEALNKLARELYPKYAGVK